MARKPKKLLFVLILIGLLTSGIGCNDGSQDEDGKCADCDDDDDNDNDNNDNDNNDDDNDSNMGCPTNEVESPPDGIAPEPDILCQASDPVAESNKAAPMELYALSDNLCMVAGRINPTKDLKSRIVGLPKVEIVEADQKEFEAATISETRAFQDGFSFDMAFPETNYDCRNPMYATQYSPGIVLKVTFEIDCGDASGDTKMVSSTTYFELCGGYDEPKAWVASGGKCEICYVSEMVAPPLSAQRVEKNGALAGSPKAEIVPIAQYGRKVVLFADHRGTEGPLTYSWRASGGSIVGTDQAGVIWEVPLDPGPHMIQVAVYDSTSAAVAVLKWQHKP